MFRTALPHRRPRRSESLAAMLIVLALGAGSAAAFSSGPPDGFCGNPPANFTCALCHGSFPPNSGSGSLSIGNLPALFSPGVTYDLSVILSDPDALRWGFEFTVLGPTDTQAGTVAVMDPVNTQLSDNPGSDPDYLKHTSAGTYQGTPAGPVSWDFQWTAPADVDEVTFYLAGNGANNDLDSSGDRIYVVAFTVPRDPGVPAVAATWSRIKAQFGR